MSRLRVAAFIVVAWALFGVALGQQVYLLQGGRGPVGIWSHATALQVHYALLWALATPGILWLGRRFPVIVPRARRTRGARWRAAVHLPASVGCAVVVQLAHAALLSRIFPGWFPRPPLADLARSAVSNVDYGCILYGIVFLIGQAFDYVRSLDQAQVRQAELQEELVQAQLQALRMQMQPHFLFNALNSIAELIHERPAAAEHMVVELGELLRTYLRSGQAQEVPLTDELDFLRRYLELQQVRFEDRLAVAIELEPGAADAFVPSLVLQPLVENALRHGVADREEGGAIEIRAAVRDARLELSVTDNGPGIADPSPGTGLGNTRRRLDRIYGADHELSVRALAAGGTRATIRIPLKSAEAARG
jgi:signal transduction histidine kinase